MGDSVAVSSTYSPEGSKEGSGSATAVAWKTTFHPLPGSHKHLGRGLPGRQQDGSREAAGDMSEELGNSGRARVGWDGHKTDQPLRGRAQCPHAARGADVGRERRRGAAVALQWQAHPVPVALDGHDDDSGDIVVDSYRSPAVPGKSGNYSTGWARQIHNEVQS